MDDRGSTLVAMLTLGFCAGVLGGLFGIGGGLVIVPVLVLIFGIDQKTATGTSLFALVWPVGLLGVLEYYSRGEARLDWGTTVALGIVGGILLGARLTAPLAPSTMKRSYGIFLLLVGLYFLISQSRAGMEPGAAGVVEQPVWVGLGVGFVAGVLGGLFGIGGGLVIVPALKLIAGLDQKTATGTSLFAQVWPVGLLGVLEYRRRGESRADYGAGIALGLLLGNLLGAKLTAPISQGALQHLYGGFCLLVGLYYQRSQSPKVPAPAPILLPDSADNPPASGEPISD